jgi:hypothetical protein
MDLPYVFLEGLKVTFIYDGIPIFFSFFWLGESREMRHVLKRPWAPCVGLQYGWPVGHFSRWTFYRLTYPPTPVQPGHIPLGEIDGRASFGIEIAKSLVRPEEWDPHLAFDCDTSA